MSLFKSLTYGLREARFNPLIIVHSTLYAATVTYLRILKIIVAIGPQRFRTYLGETYHSKVLRLDDARRLITVNKDIELRNLDQVLPFRHARDVILKNPHNIVVYECPCRAQKKEPCTPTDVCLVVGDPFVDLLRMFQPFRSRRISPDEAVRILREEDERGHVHTAWFKRTMLNRFYAICNCCKCCCLGMKFMAGYQVKMILPSGYRAIIGEGCIGCGACARQCQFDAMELIPVSGNGSERKICRVIRERCFGCGICESKCSTGAVSLLLDSGKGVPLDIEALAGTGNREGYNL
jgi:ferredoxin